MQPLAVLEHCRGIISEAQASDPSIPSFDAINNFLEGSRLVASIISSWPHERKNREPNLREFALALRKLEGDLNSEVERDPMILYTPAHEVSLAFHSSNAFIRYFRGGNRTSKTQSGYAEHYFVATGQHKWRSFNDPPAASFIIGINFSKYEPNVFAKKFLKGEADNPLSPMFPEGGKWLHSYDDRKHIVYVACPRCANAGLANSCKHLKSTITLFSDIEGPHVLQGGQYNLGHFDEHIREHFFDEAFQRLQTVAKASFIVTGTPLHGAHAWEHKKLTARYNEGSSKNRIPGTDIPFVSLHTINQYEAGLIPHESIKAWEDTADPLDIESRVYGRPAPLAKRSVFDRRVLHAMEQSIRAPRQVTLEDKSLIQGGFFNARTPVLVSEDLDGQVSIFEEPQLESTYVAGCDVAQGLTDHDFSCATVIEVPSLKMVASIHGWINPVDFAYDLAKLGKYYNMAWLVVERNGPGSGTIFTLRSLGYWNLFREVVDPTQTEYLQDPLYGVDTNIRTKAHMVAYLQKAFREKQVTIPCGATLEEMRAFGEEPTPSGLNVRMRGEGGSHDDRVMSLVFAVYAALAYDLFSKALSPAMAPAVPESNIWADIHKELRQRESSKRKLW